MGRVKLTAGEYEADENILHLWHPRGVELATEMAVDQFFDEVMEDRIRLSPKQPYLLVNYAKVHIRATMAEAYARNISRFQNLLLGSYRYAVPASFTGVAVAIGNLKLATPANIFDDERSARAAIRAAKQMSARAPKISQVAPSPLAALVRPQRKVI